MGVFASILYFIDFIVFVCYFAYKFIRRKYIFSCFNISIFVYYFSIFISPVFYNTSQAWVALNVTDYKSYYKYLDEALIVNSLGYIICMFTTAFIEYNRGRNGQNKLYRFSEKINISILDLFYWVFILAWYFIVIIFNKGLPLLNGGRTFFLGSLISPIYQALNEIILVYTLFYGMRLVYGSRFKKNIFIKMCISLLTLLFTGNRGTVLVSAFVPIMLVFINNRTRIKETRRHQKVSTNYVQNWQIVATVKIIILLVITVIIGLLLSVVRNGGTGGVSSLIFELIYGNTFSDMRDGAFILQGFQQKFGDNYLLGRTYLAGFLSFIPSSISPFMVEWRWGRFSTTMLFGWTGHFGLRGGNVMEAYLNFGVVGVVFAGIAQGILAGYLEKMFYKIFFLGDVRHNGREYIILLCLSSLSNILINTAALYNIYVYIVFYILITLPIYLGKSTEKVKLREGKI